MTTEQAQFSNPPRVTGNQNEDLRALVNWLWSFFNSAIRQGGLVQTTDFGAQLLEQYPILYNLGNLTLVADRIAYSTSDTEWALTPVSAFIRTLLDDADGAAAQATLGISAIISDPELLAIAGLTSAADKLSYFTGSGTAALADFTSLARTLLALTTASQWRTNIGVAIGSDVQAYDADLGTLAANITAFGHSLVDDADAAAARTTLGLASGVATPTLTNITNVAASTAYECQYMRVGDTVSVSGRIDIDPTAAGQVQVGISLPIASNFGATEDCAGVAFSPAVAGLGAGIGGDAANNRAQLEFVAVDTANRAFYFTYQYQVI